MAREKNASIPFPPAAARMGDLAGSGIAAPVGVPSMRVATETLADDVREMEPIVAEWGRIRKQTEIASRPTMAMTTQSHPGFNLTFLSRLIWMRSGRLRKPAATRS